LKKPTPERLANVALYYLARYAATEASLRRVLENRVRRAVMQDVVFAADREAQAALVKAIDHIVEQHKASGVINDEAFAAMKVESLRRAGRSARRITQTLAVKGIKAEATQRALESYEQDEGEGQELAAALRFAKKKKMGRFAPPSPPATDAALVAKRKNKEVAAMARAGFSFDVIRKVLEADIDGAEA
jgi:regulatory protein